MRKTIVIAVREYLAAVKSKAFLITLIALPLLMLGSPLLQKLTSKVGDIADRKVAVVDRTDGQALIKALQTSATERNETKIFDPATHKQIEPKFEIEAVTPSADSADAIAAQRFELSQQIRDGKIFAYIEMGRDVLQPHQEAANASAEAMTDEALIRYTSNSPTYMNVRNWAQVTLINVVEGIRFEKNGIAANLVKTLMVPPTLVPAGLYVKDSTGAIVRPKIEDNTIIAFVLPVALAILLYIVVLIGASPMAMNVIEEKQLRIAEVLLGSLTPFELMLGKLLGGVGVALTLGALYLGGAMSIAYRMGYLQYVPIPVLIWFIGFLVLAVLMYGSMFVAVGAAASNMKEAQSLIFPVIMIIVFPMMMLGNLIQYPNGPLAMGLSFFPLSAPIVTVTRLAVPPGIPVWQPIVSILVALLTTVVMVFAAGRVFRIGILLQGQGANFRQIIRWMIRG